MAQIKVFFFFVFACVLFMFHLFLCFVLAILVGGDDKNRRSIEKLCMTNKKNTQIRRQQWQRRLQLIWGKFFKQKKFFQILTRRGKLFLKAAYRKQISAPKEIFSFFAINYSVEGEIVWFFLRVICCRSLSFCSYGHKILLLSIALLY